MAWRAALVVALSLVVHPESAPAQGRVPSPDSSADDNFVPLGGGPIDPGGDRVWSAADCGRCHQREYRQWRGSAHRRSFTNTLFRLEHRERRRPACAACHAPLSSAPWEDAAAEEGVGCVACHMRDGIVLASTISGRAPHPSRLEPRLSDVRSCEACHNFDQPGRPGQPLQQTVDEWRQSETSVSCQACHMRPGGGARMSHAFVGGHDPAMLERALHVRASAHYEGRQTIITLVLESRAGHAVPTGDVFRRLSLRAWPAGRVGERRESRFGGGTVRRLADASYDRVPPTGRGERTVELVLVGRHARVAWRLDLLHLQMRQRRRSPQLERGELRVRMASGTVSAGSDRSSD